MDARSPFLIRMDFGLVPVPEASEVYGLGSVGTRNRDFSALAEL